MKNEKWYACRDCGYRTAGWLGRCPLCGNFNTLEALPGPLESKKREASVTATFHPLQNYEASSKSRLKTGINEFDSVLGGGLVAGSVTLISGEPGIGKSTLLLQVAGAVSEKGKVVYLSGEESFEQIALRAKRLEIGSQNILVAAETEVNSVLSGIKPEDTVLLIADSVQTLYSGDLDAIPGSVVQVREVALRLVSFAKKNNIPVIIVGHVTKEGSIAGPKLLEHIVDTVVYFEGDRHHLFRILRTTKNRFGPTDEVGIFEMTSRGLMPVLNPSAAFLSDVNLDSSVVFPALEGTRVILTEVQSIVSPTFYPNARRTSLGIDPVRMSVIVAVLETRASVSFSGCDIYLTTSSGLRVRETAADLPVAISLYRSLTSKTSGTVAAFGELGLDGSVRRVFQPELRLRELERFGIKKVIVPDYDRINHNFSNGFELVRVKTLQEALEAIA